VFEATVKSCQQNGIRGGCWEQDTEVQVVDCVEIDGVEYSLDDKIDINGKKITVREYINSTEEPVCA